MSEVLALSETAMILAAGLGLRMQPLSLQKPKPLLEIGGKTMLDRALDKLVDVGIKRAVVNVFYLREQIETHLQKRSDIEIIISPEEKLLDTGGGIKRALSYFDKPFFSLNADLTWMDDEPPSLDAMRRAWDPSRMDAFLLLMPLKKARGFSDKGDFAMANGGQVSRKNVSFPRPFVALAAQIVKPELYAEVTNEVFSNNLIWDRAEERQRLFGFPCSGSCYHVGTPEDFTDANNLLQQGKGWRMP